MDARAINLLAALLLLLASSCALKEEAALVLPQGKQSYFLEAYLSPGAPATVCLSRTNSFQEDISLRLVWYAIGILSTPDTTLPLNNIFYRDSKNGKLINYANPHLLSPGNGLDSIRIQIISESGKDTLYAATEVVEAIEIKRWNLQDRQLQLFCNNGSGPANRYYCVFVEGKKEGKTFRKSVYYDHRAISDPVLNLTVQLLASEQVKKIILYRITAANYGFQMALQQASRSNIDPFEPPVGLPTNIRGGQGIFTYCTTDTLNIE